MREVKVTVWDDQSIEDEREPLVHSLEASAWAVAPWDGDDDTVPGLNVSLNGIVGADVELLIPEAVLIGALAKLNQMRESQPDRFLSNDQRARLDAARRLLTGGDE